MKICYTFIQETFLETQTEHLPDLLSRVISSLSMNIDSMCDSDIRCVLLTCSKLLSKVQPSMNAIEADNAQDDEVRYFYAAL